MTKEERAKKIVQEIEQLKKNIEEVDLPMELAHKAAEACGDTLDGERGDKVIDALLVHAFCAGLQCLDNRSDCNELKNHLEFMTSRAKIVFSALTGAMCLKNIMKEAGVL